MKITKIINFIKHVFTVIVLLAPGIAFIYFYFFTGKTENWKISLVLAIMSLLATILYLYVNLKDIKTKVLADDYEELLDKGYSEKEIDKIISEKYGNNNH